LHLRLVTFGAGVGTLFWTLVVFSTLMPLGNIGAVFVAYFVTYGGLIRSGQGSTSLEATPSALFQTMFWLMLASWMGHGSHCSPVGGSQNMAGSRPNI